MKNVELKKDEILSNMNDYIKLAKEKFNDSDLTIDDRTNYYKIQITLEGMLELYKQDEKDLLFYRQGLRTSICPICGKEFHHKRSDCIYCSDCTKQATYDKWKASLVGEKRARRNAQTKENAQKYREMKKKGDL